MSKAWETLKKIVLILLIVYVTIVLVETDFLLNLITVKLKIDIRRYLFKILNLE